MSSQVRISPEHAVIHPVEEVTPCTSDSCRWANATHWQSTDGSEVIDTLWCATCGRIVIGTYSQADGLDFFVGVPDMTAAAIKASSGGTH